MIQEEFIVQKKDMALLYALRANARLTLTQISRKTRIPISTLHDRLKTQEKNIIHKYATLIDFTKLGFHTRVHLQIKANPQKKALLLSYLTNHEQVNCLYKIAHGFDFFVEAIFKQVNEVEAFIETLQEDYAVVDYHAHYITKDIKRESFLAAL